MARMFGAGAVVGLVCLAGCAGSPASPEPAAAVEVPVASQAETPVEQAAHVSPYVGTWTLDRESTWLTVWTVAFGKAEEVNMPEDQYNEMSAKINEVVDSMSVEVVIREDGTLFIEFEMGPQQDSSTGTWTLLEDGSIDMVAQSDTNSEKTGETAAIGTIEGTKLVMVTPADPSGFGTIKFNRASK